MTSRALSARVDELTPPGVPFVQATVVRAQEPTSRPRRATARSCWPTAPSRASSAGTAPSRLGADGRARTRSTRGETLLLRVLPDGDDAFPDAPGASIVVNPCLSGGAMEIFLEPLLPVARAAPRRHLADRRGPRGRWRPRSASSVERAAEASRPGRRRRRDRRHARRRGRRGPGRARRRRRVRRRRVQPHPGRPPCWPSSTLSPDGGERACTRTSGSTSAPAPRPRSRCRSWRRSCGHPGRGTRAVPPGAAPAPARRRPSTRSAG